MDKSLKFFINIEQNGGNKDQKTGLNKTTIDGEVIINYYEEDDPKKITRTEKKPYKYDALESGINPGQYINYLGNSPTNSIEPFATNAEHESDIRLSDIINWTQTTYPSLKLVPKHVAYLKNFNVYPANRLMILRRFKGPAQHDLFRTKSKPIATMVTYYDFDEIPVKISFNEKWKPFDSDFLSVIQDIIGINFESLGKVGKATTSGLGQDLMYKLGEKLGFISNGVMPYGDPNLIHDATIRDVSGEKIQTGLHSSISVDFETTYVMNEILGVDGKAAMLDILANVTKMATSDGRFLAGDNFSQVTNFIKKLQGDNPGGAIIDAFRTVFSDVIQFATNTIEGATKDINSFISGNGGDKGAIVEKYIQSAFAGVNEIIKQRLGRYKWNLFGASAAVIGSHTGPWHITLGNPKFPWFVCGNMIIDECEIIPGGELGYNDMFSELTVKIKLKAGRVMGGDEICNLFNAGKGRIYDTPSKVITYTVKEGTNVKVPQEGGTIEFTGPQSKTDVTNLLVDPGALNLPPSGTFTPFSINNNPGI